MCRRLSRKRGHDRPVSHWPTGKELGTTGVVFQRYKKKQSDDLPMLGNWPRRFVAAHYVTRFLACYRVGQEREGVRQVTPGEMASTSKTQVVSANRG